MTDISIEVDLGRMHIDVTAWDDDAVEEIVRASAHRFFENDEPYVALRGAIELEDGTFSTFSVTMSQDEAKELAWELEEASKADPDPIVERNS